MRDVLSHFGEKEASVLKSTQRVPDAIYPYSGYRGVSSVDGKSVSTAIPVTSLVELKRRVEPGSDAAGYLTTI